MGKPQPPGYVLYLGPSALRGRDSIVAIVTVGSANVKTGPMWQLWILNADLHPVDAVKQYKDDVVCGDCRHRGTSCYVMVHWAPAGIWEAFHRGLYHPGPPEVLPAGTQVRLGAYGDPAAIPCSPFTDIVNLGWAGWTGYTHQWRRTFVQYYKPWLMASVDTEAEYEEATGLGWRTFRARRQLDPLLPGEIICPASEEGGHRTTCDKCQLCRGTQRPAKNIAIYLHGKSRGLWLKKQREVLPL